MDMELYQIKCVLTVAKYNNFSKAAAELCVTPPALSQQIKKFEEELGIELFIRTTRCVRLSQAGIEFVEKSQKVISEISEINDIMKKYANGTNGQLVIGCIPVLKEYGITHLIRLFAKKYPDVSLDFHEAEHFDLYPLLYSGEIDVAMLTVFDKTKPKNIKLKSYPLIDDEFVIVTNNDHPLAVKKVISLEEVSKEHFILFSGLYQETVDACNEAGFMPKFTHYGTHRLDTTLGLVAEGAGIAMVPLAEVTHIQWENITIIRLVPKIKRTLMMVIPLFQKKNPFY